MWDTIILQPMVNTIVVLANSMWGIFGLAVIVLTIIIRLITIPLTLKQLHSTKAMQTLSPKLREMQKLYAKDKAKLQAETMKLYREAGVNPMGCLVPMVIQFPIWIALYQSIIRTLGNTPEDLLGLSRLLYSQPASLQAIPLNEHFLWLNLSVPDPFYILPILVGVSMWAQQKMTTQPGAGAEPSQQQMNTMMLWMMPIMFAFFTLQFPSGLALYWIAFNIIGIAIQYFVTGWGGLATVPVLQRFIAPKQATADHPLLGKTTERKPSEGKVDYYGKRVRRDKRKER